MTTTYTVINHHGTEQGTGLTVREAAQTVLRYDNHNYEIRRDGDGFRLFHTVRGGGGNVPMTGTLIWSFEEEEDDAENEIFAEVIRHADCFGDQQVMTDADYAAMLADIEAQNQE